MSTNSTNTFTKDQCQFGNCFCFLDFDFEHIVHFSLIVVLSFWDSLRLCVFGCVWLIAANCFNVLLSALSSLWFQLDVCKFFLLFVLATLALHFFDAPSNCVSCLFGVFSFSHGLCVFRIFSDVLLRVFFLLGLCLCFLSFFSLLWSFLHN